MTVTNYTLPNSSSLLELFQWTNSVTYDLFVSGFILTLGLIIAVRMISKGNDLADSFFTASLITFVLSLIATSLQLLSGTWLAFNIALLILGVVYKYWMSG